MAEAEVTVQRAAREPARSAALDRQLAAERTMMRSIVHGILTALPFAIVFTAHLLDEPGEEDEHVTHPT